MEFIFYLFIFLFGLIIGSFLNVVIFRLESGEQMARGRSHCRDCRHALAWHDLIPVLSFLALGGKCRYCGKALSRQYPSIELATAILFVIIFNFQFSIFNELSITNFQISGSAFYFLFSAFYYFFIISTLIVIFVYDFRHYIIPDSVIYPAIAVSIVYQLVNVLKFVNLDLFGNWNLEIENWMILFNPFIAAVLAGGFFFAIMAMTRGEGMGGGDVKLAFLMGLTLGWPKILAALFLAFTSGAICGIILMILKKKKFKSEIPFGPFLVLGTFIAMFLGEDIINWYGRYLF